MMNSKTRARLRAMANTVEAILQVGKNGMGDALQKQAPGKNRGFFVYFSLEKSALQW